MVWEVIFVQLILDNYDDNHFFSSCDWTKTMERERKRERIKTHVNMREKVVLKVVKK